MTLASASRLYSADSQKAETAAGYEYRSAKALGLKEDWFQRVIAANPLLVIEPCRHGGLTTGEDWYFWAREFGVVTDEGTIGSIDVLLISSAGRIGIVETKLAYNPEKRRDVVAQVLDYAVNISELDPDRLPPLPEIDGQPVASRNDVQIHLAEGDHLLAVVGDELDPRAIKLSQAVLGEHLATPWHLALVELSPYQKISSEDGFSLILVPSLRTALRPELRQIVKVVVEGKSPKAQVTIERVSPSDKNRLWTEEEFLDNVGRPGTRARQVGESLIALGRSVSNRNPYGSPSKNGSAIFDLDVVELFTLYPEALYIRVLRNRREKGGPVKGAPVTEQEWDEVISRLNACQLGTFAKEDIGHARLVLKPLAEITDEEVAHFKEFVQWFVEGVRKR